MLDIILLTILLGCLIGTSSAAILFYFTRYKKAGKQMKNLQIKSEYIVPTASFRRIDVKDGFVRDTEAIASYWKAVGGDMKTAIKQFEEELKSKENQ